MIDLRQFRQYVAVAETLNFRRAAERLNMAQPPLSTAIRRLEEELGVTLLERDNRVSRLTAAGEVFLLEARRTLEQADRACAAARLAAAGLSGSLRLSFVDSTVNGLLPRLLRDFQARHPQVDLHLQEATPPEQMEALRQDRTDIGILVLPIADAGDIQLEPLLSDRMVAVLAAEHRLARRKRLALAELADEPWVLFAHHHGPGMHARILLACAQAGFVPRVVQQPRQMQTTAGLVAGQVGVALMPRLYANRHHGGLVQCEISGPGSPIPYELAIAYRQLSPGARALRDLALQIVRSDSDD